MKTRFSKKRSKVKYTQPVSFKLIKDYLHQLNTSYAQIDAELKKRNKKTLLFKDVLMP
jgi:hypothetical protein